MRSAGRASGDEQNASQLQVESVTDVLIRLVIEVLQRLRNQRRHEHSRLDQIFVVATTAMLLEVCSANLAVR